MIFRKTGWYNFFWLWLTLAGHSCENILIVSDKKIGFHLKTQNENESWKPVAENSLKFRLKGSNSDQNYYNSSLRQLINASASLISNILEATFASEIEP